MLAPAILKPGGPARAQTRDEIRQQNEQLYQQYQSQPDQSQPGQSQPGQPALPSAEPFAPSYDGGAGASPAPRSGAGGLTARLLDRVLQLEQQVRTLRGRVDQLERDQQTSTASLNKQLGDLSFQLQQGGAHPAPPPASPSPAPAPPTTTRSPVRLTPETALRQGNLALARHDYPAAQEAARVALQGGRGIHGTDAEYLLAQSYAGQHNDQQAAVAFYDAYNRAPHGPLAPGALLHVSQSMASLGQTGAACEALAKLHAEFPAAHGVTRAATGLHARLHCP